MSGVMIFVDESPIRYANWQSSGLYPSCINIGTNTGARIFHFAEDDPIKRFISAEKRTNIIIRGTSPMLTVSKKLAPDMAIMVPSFV